MNGKNGFSCGGEPWRVKGPVFDSSRLMVEAALLTDSIALVPSCMFSHELSAGALVNF